MVQLCFRDSDTAEHYWQQLKNVLVPVLRKAYQHV
jgi:hypothetical protein